MKDLKISEMSNTANVLVKFEDEHKSLIVKCVITFNTPVNDFRFSLSTLLIIDHVLSDTESEWHITREWQPQWQYKSNEIKVSSKTPMQELVIEYHGHIAGWCNIMEEQRIALSSYSAWTIFESSIPVSFLFRLGNMEDYFIINAKYNTPEKIWIYGETEHDVGNIIALKKDHFHVANKGNFYFYYLNEAEKEYADCYTSNYGDIIDYFTSVFGKKHINKMSVVSLDFDKGGGAYFRNELMVIDKINVSEEEESIKQNVIGLLGHELAHNWFTGADTTTWEDWLNETGAEWAALLYILSLNDKEFFEKQLSRSKERYIKTPIIKSSDGKRPVDGVHTRGVVMFYEIYQKYGIENILTILKTLVNLNEKTTANFLSELKIKIDNEIPDKMEQGLTLKDYSELFS